MSANTLSSSPEIGHELDPKDNKLAKILFTLFSDDKIPDGFYEAMIRMMQNFNAEKREWNTSFLDIWKGILRDVENGVDAEFSAIREYIRTRFVHLLSVKSSNAIRKLNGVSEHYAFSVDAFEQMDPDSYTQYTAFLVIGCPWSTDIDVIVFCPASANNDGNVVPLFTSEFYRLKVEIATLGYDVEGRDVDYNLIVVENDVIVASTKGGKETANIALATHHFHAQQMNDVGDTPLALELFPLQIVELGSEEFETKVRSLAKYCWDFLKYLTPKDKYDEFYDIRRSVYEMEMRALMTQLPKLLPLIVTDPEHAALIGLDMTHWRTRFKSLTMKLVQIIVFHLDSTMTYTKAEIAEDSRKIATAHPLELSEDAVYAGCLYNLSRGSRGEFQSGLFEALIEIYLKIVDEILDDSAKTSFAVNSDSLENCLPGFPEPLSLELVQMFLTSPKNATTDFEAAWYAHIDEVFHEDRTVNQVFIQDLTSAVRFLAEIRELKLVPSSTLEVIARQFVMVGQRTEEWKHLLSSVYKCGNNGAEIGTSFQALYNLIRGSILEEWCTEFCPAFDLRVLGEMLDKASTLDVSILSNVVRVFPLETGLVVEEIGKFGCAGAAPDLMLVCLREMDGVPVEPLLIPIEMKGLKTGASRSQPKYNGDYRRGLSLATRQISSVKRVVTSGFVIPFGLIVLCWIFDSDLCMEVHVIPF
jgi:hypothetical protein